MAVPIHEAVLAIPAMAYGLFEKLKSAATTIQVVPPRETFEF